MVGEPRPLEKTPEQQMADSTYARARDWQKIFDDMPPGSDIDSLRDQAVQELDSTFPYLRRAVYVSGNGLHPVFDSETNEILGEAISYKEGITGRHDGFIVLEVADDSGETAGYQVTQQIFIGHAENALSLTIHRRFEFYSFFDLDSRLVAVDEVNELFYGERNSEEQLDFNQQMDALASSSKGLY